MGMSERIVSFIGSLSPLYSQEKVGGIWCARSISDGTLIVPVDELEGEEVGWILVRWQGDAARTSEMLGANMASFAIARYVEMHHTATYNKQTQAAMEHLSNHFTFKTGDSLVFESAESHLLEVLTKAVAKVGESVVVDMLKRQIGL